MIHQLDHSTNEGSACNEYTKGKDCLTPHIKWVTCSWCKSWLKIPANRRQAEDLEARVMGKNLA